MGSSSSTTIVTDPYNNIIIRRIQEKTIQENKNKVPQPTKKKNVLPKVK